MTVTLKSNGTYLYKTNVHLTAMACGDKKHETYYIGSQLGDVRIRIASIGNQIKLWVKVKPFVSQFFSCNWNYFDLTYRLKVWIFSRQWFWSMALNNRQTSGQKGHNELDISPLSPMMTKNELVLAIDCRQWRLHAMAPMVHLMTINVNCDSHWLSAIAIGHHWFHLNVKKINWWIHDQDRH